MAYRITPARDRANSTVMDMLNTNQFGCTIKELADASGVSRATVRRILVPLVENGALRTFRDPHGTQWLRYQLTVNPAPINRRKKK